MNIVDTHVHTSPYWYEPVEILLFQMNNNGVSKANLVQFIGQTDNSYIIECARRFPGRFSPVAMVDVKREDAPEILRQGVKEGIEGVRFKAYERSPGKDPLAIWRASSELGLPVSCNGGEAEFASDEFRQIIETLPNLTIIIEHLGHVSRSDEPPYETFQKVLSLSRYPNTYMKMGGLGEICPRPYPFRQPSPFADVPPFLRMACEAFGPSRIMWGSNYPPSSYLEGYRNTLVYLRDYLAGFLSDSDKEWIFGKTALSVYKFKQ